MKRILALTAFIVTAFALTWLATQSGYAGGYNPDPSRWEVISPPVPWDLEESNSFWARANQSDHEWTVEGTNGKVEARLQEYPPAKAKEQPPFDTTVEYAPIAPGPLSPDRTLKVSDGWLAAYNRGEFGSVVFWFSADGKEKKEVSNYQINQFLADGDRILAVQGLSHLGMSQGSIVEILKDETGWKIKEFIPLSEAAQTITRIGKGDYLVATANMLLRVNLQREVRILLPNAGWSGLYPNSMATDGTYIYVGMRQFVGRCKLGTSVQTLELLVPDRKWLNTKELPFFKGTPFSA